MSHLDPHASRYRPLLAPATTGEWTLPRDVLDAYQAVTRLVDGLKRLEPPELPFDQHVSAALSAKSPHTLDVSGLVDHDRALREHDVRIEVLTFALRKADDLLSTLIHGQRDQIIREHLAPTGERLWADVVATVDELGNAAAAGPVAIQSATEQQRAAYVKLDDTTGYARRYSTLRTAWSLAVGQQAAELDYDNHHAEFRAGLCVVWPERNRSWTAQRASPPWPKDLRDRLVWLVRNGYTPWWPTRAQQDEAWSASHGDRRSGFKVHVSAVDEFD